MIAEIWGSQRHFHLLDADSGRRESSQFLTYRAESYWAVEHFLFGVGVSQADNLDHLALDNRGAAVESRESFWEASDRRRLMLEHQAPAVIEVKGKLICKKVLKKLKSVDMLKIVQDLEDCC